MSERPPDKVQIIRQTRNKLKAKAGADGMMPGEKPAFDEAAIADLDTAFKEASEKYPNAAEESLSTLIELVTKYDGAHKGGQPTETWINKIHALAHDFKGQGSTFGYPLISTFGQSLFNFTKPNVKETEHHSEILKAHSDAIKIVIHQKIAGDGGEVGQELTKALQEALYKHLNRGKA